MYVFVESIFCFIDLFLSLYCGTILITIVLNKKTLLVIFLITLTKNLTEEFKKNKVCVLARGWRELAYHGEQQEHGECEQTVYW